MPIYAGRSLLWHLKIRSRTLEGGSAMEVTSNRQMSSRGRRRFWFKKPGAYAQTLKSNSTVRLQNKGSSVIAPIYIYIIERNISASASGEVTTVHYVDTLSPASSYE
jgi:hypothetical protein